MESEKRGLMTIARKKGRRCGFFRPFIWDPGTLQTCLIPLLYIPPRRVISRGIEARYLIP